MWIATTTQYLPEASFTKEINPRLAKRPFKTNGRKANHGLASLVKEATGNTAYSIAVQFMAKYTKVWQMWKLAKALDRNMKKWNSLFLMHIEINIMKLVWWGRKWIELPASNFYIRFWLYNPLNGYTNLSFLINPIANQCIYFIYHPTEWKWNYGFLEQGFLLRMADIKRITTTILNALTHVSHHAAHKYYTNLQYKTSGLSD